MKTALALAYFFGSVLAAVGALWLGFSLAPPEYTPDGRALAVEAGRLARPDLVFPDWPSKEPIPSAASPAPSSLAGIRARKDGARAELMVFADAGAARSAFRNLTAAASASAGPRQSSGPDRLDFTDPAGRRNAIRRIDRVVVRIEADREEHIERSLRESAVLVPNPGANVLTAIFRRGEHLPALFVVIALYAALQLRIWNRIGSWAAAVVPAPGVEPVSGPELRRRLLALNDLDAPLRAVERKDGTIDVTWRLADARWAGLMTLSGVRTIASIRLRLSEKERVCRALDIARSLRFTADGPRTGFSLEGAFFRGIVLGRWEYEKQAGIVVRDGLPTVGTAYEYTFRHAELKNPVVNIVVQGGWQYRPVMFLSRILGG